MTHTLPLASCDSPTPHLAPSRSLSLARCSILTLWAVFALTVSTRSQIPIERQFAAVSRQHLPADQTQTKTLASGDIDGDGDVDLICGNRIGINVPDETRIYLNEGDGFFVDSTNGRLPATLHIAGALALLDVDRDGDLDLFIGTSWSRNPNHLYLNDGTGTFTDATATHLPGSTNWVTGVESGDVDSDGDLDLVLAARGPNVLYINDGSGRYAAAPASSFPTSYRFSSAVALGDVDGDGDLDVAVSNEGPCNRGCIGEQNTLHLNDGTGVFTEVTATALPSASEHTNSLALGDVDGDGDLDIVYGDGVHTAPRLTRLLINDGTGRFRDEFFRLPILQSITRTVSLADVDGDGDLDLLRGNEASNQLQLNNGNGFFVPSKDLPPDLDVTLCSLFVDTDGDADLDLITGNVEQNQLWSNDGRGVFTQGVAPLLPSRREAHTAVAAGDFNGDGSIDVVFGNNFRGGSDLRILWNDGHGTLIDGNSPPNRQAGTWDIQVGDVDGDGDLDLATASSTSNGLFLNDGSGRFSDVSASRLPQNSGSEAIAIGDLDQDADLDLVVGVARGTNRIHLNDGTGHFTDGTTGRLAPRSENTRCLALADIDHDGDLDLVEGNGVAGIGLPYQLDRLYVNDGTGRFTDVTNRLPLDRTATESLDLADIDGDGNLDLMIVGYGTDTGSKSIRLLLNDGTGRFVAGGQLPAQLPIASGVALGDIDLDGDVDMVCSTGLTGADRNRLYVNDGRGTFTEQTATGMPDEESPSQDLALIDLDADGDLDLIFANLNEYSRSYLNLNRQLIAPRLLRAGQPFTLRALSRNPSGGVGMVESAFPWVSFGRSEVILPGVGRIGIDLQLAAPLPAFQLDPATGAGMTHMSVPNSVSLRGVPLWFQAILVRGSSRPRLTNVICNVVDR